VLAFLGLIFTIGGSVVAWWAFNQAKTGDVFYSWIWLAAMIISVLGILLFIICFRRWWMSE
jgi:hypothetical protein